MVIYVEGGGENKLLRTECRQGFSKFLAKAGFEGRMPRIVACGSRNDAFYSFLTASSQGKTAVLLVDSEGPLSGGSCRAHLESRDKWRFDDGIDDDAIHLMTQCMEAWFLADEQALATFFGNGFRSNALPARKNVEDVPKSDIFAHLQRATETTKTKGKYGKGVHSFKLLALLDPDKVRSRSPHADRLLLYLNRELS